MPFAVMVLCNPVGAYAALVVAIAAALFAAQSQRFLPGFTAVSIGMLALLAFLQLSPHPSGLAWLCVGVALLHVEFLWPTFGAAGLLGLAATAWGSCLLVQPLAVLPRACVALLGTLLLLAAVARTMRRRTLP